MWTAGKIALACLAISLGAAGCNSYKYFDIHVRFAGTFDQVSVGQVNDVTVTVSGADSGNSLLSGCPNRVSGANLLDCGVFEFSTFADSGNLVFTAKAFESNNQTDACKSGEGSVTVPVSSETTIM